MKKQSGLLRRLTALALALCMLAALTSEIFAADTVASGKCGANGSNLTWTLDSEGTLTISGKGEMKDYSNTNRYSSSKGYAPWYDKRTEIKKLIIEPGVTTIGDSAFYGCYIISGELNIPSGVTSIGPDAFHFCSGFSGDLNIPDSVEEIGNGAFSECSGFNGNLTIPDSVVKIGYSAFAGCIRFTGDLIIPNSVLEIGNGAFSGCKGFNGNLILSNNVTTIEQRTFYNCSGFTGDLAIPDSVTVVESWAFGVCSGFNGSLTLGNKLETIGSLAFSACSGFTGSLAIPDSVTFIGMQAFSSCSGFNGELTIGNGVTTIDQRAFNKCSGFKKLNIGKNVTEIVAYAFTGCSGFTGRLIIPDSVKKIETYAFQNCYGFDDAVIMGSGVTDIGYNAFNGCSGISDVFFRGNAPTAISTPIFGTTCTFYYIPGATGWIDSSAYDTTEGTWNGYLLRTWDGKNIPAKVNTAVLEGKYCIQVIDENGFPISGAKVTWDSKSESTDQKGEVFFDLATAESPVIHVSKTGYTTWTNENSNWQKNERRFERIILYPESYGGLKLKSAKIGKCDLLTQTKVLNLRNDGALIGDLNWGYFELSCEAADTSDVMGYTLYQNNKIIGSSPNGNFKGLDVRDFVKGGGCFIRVLSKAGKTADTQINLQFAENSVNEDFAFELKGKKVSFKVSDKIPYVGGSSVSFALPMTAPVVVSATMDKVQLGINLKLSEGESKDKQVDDYIKMLKKTAAAGRTKLTKANAKALKNCVAKNNKAKFFQNIDVTLVGYAEAEFGSKTASGYLMFIADVKVAELEYNTVLWVVPITIQVDVDFSLEAGGMLGYRFDTKTWNGNVFLNPSIALSPFFGVGISDVVGAGVYGEGSLAVKWNVFGTNSGLRNVDLTAELGIKGYIGPLEAHKAFAHQTWHLYTANSVKSYSLRSGAAWDAAPEASAYAPSDLSYLAEESDWAPAAVRTYAARAAQARTEYHPLLENTYRNAQPVMVSDGSALYAAFVSADAASGARYVALTKFDGTSWSEPVRADAGAILDDAPQLCTDAAGNLWLAYARTTQEPGDSLVAYAQHQNIVVGTVDKSALTFTEQKVYQSDNYMRLPALSCVNGTPVLAWAESAVTGEESVVNPTASAVYTAEYRGGAWLDARKAADAAGVGSICIGAQNGAPAVAYTADGKLYCGSRLLAENVTGRAVYGRLPGTTADSFIWNADGALHDEKGTKIPVEGLGRDFVIVGDSIYFNQSNGASANLAALHYDAVNDHWSAPILLIGDEQYLENLNAAELNGKTYALGMHTTVTISEDEVDDAKDLVWTQIQPVSDLKISDVSFDSDALTPGEMLPVTLTVTNAGDHAVTELAFTVNGTESMQTCTLLPGESTGCTVNITCPSAKRTVDFAVQEPDQDDYTPEDNTTACTIGSADAETELTLIQIGSRRLLQAAVTNRGLEPASGSVLFTGPDGELLAERTFQNLTYGGTVIAEFEPESFSDLYGEDVTATVRLQQDEPNTLNNTDSVPILLTSTEILSAQRGGTAVTAEIACMHDSARALCAFYDATGRLLSTSIQTLQSGQTNSLSFTIGDPNAAYAKLFVLDAKSAPAAAGKTVQLNG